MGLAEGAIVTWHGKPRWGRFSNLLSEYALNMISSDCRGRPKSSAWGHIHYIYYLYRVILYLKWAWAREGVERIPASRWTHRHWHSSEWESKLRRCV